MVVAKRSLYLFIALLTSFCHSQTTTENVLTEGDLKRVYLSTNVIHKFRIVPSSKNNAGFIFQLHSQNNIMHLSRSEDFTYGETAQGTNIGLWEHSSFTFYMYYVNVTCNQDTCDNVGVSILAAVVSVDYDAPLPGGCTLVSPLATDPNIQLSYASYTTTVTFQDSNQGFNQSGYQPQCTEGRGPVFPVTQLEYTIYRKQLPTEDYSNNTFLSAMEEVLNLDNVLSLPSANKGPNGIKTLSFDSFAGDGAIYIVTVTSRVSGKTSSYVPAITYACDLSPVTNVCTSDTSLVVNIITSLILCGLGLFLCFLSHRLFHLEVILFSWVSFSYLIFMTDTALMSGDNSHTIRVAIAIIGGLVLSLIPFVLWFFTGWYLPIIFIFSGSAGFLLGATLLYTPLGSLQIFHISYVYGLFLACFVVLLLIPAVIGPRVMNIIISSFMGGYIVIFAIGLFVFTTLDEIVLKVVKIATVGNGYLKSQQAYPFALNDILLASSWAVLMLLGILIQSVLARKRDPFPTPSLYKKLTNKREQRSHRQAINDSERRKLLSAYPRSPTRVESAEYNTFNY